MDKTALPFANRGRRIPREGARLRRTHGLSATPENCSTAPRRAKDLINRDALVRGIDAWLTQCHARKMSAATLYSRKFVTDKLLWFMDQNALDGCDRAILGKFLAYAGSAPKDGSNRWGGSTKQTASQREAKPETVATYHRMLRTLFRWLVTEKYLEESPMEKLKPPVVRAVNGGPKFPISADENSPVRRRFCLLSRPRFQVPFLAATAPPPSSASRLSRLLCSPAFLLSFMR